MSVCLFFCYTIAYNFFLWLYNAYNYFVYTCVCKENSWFFSFPIIFYNKFCYKNTIFLVSFKNIYYMILYLLHC